MIPHIIHYCWFGPAKKSQMIRKCIASWHQMCPDWEIREWNESNYDVNKNDYIKAAYADRKWAYVVDFARFDILNQYGGVFMDTDVELLKPFPETFLALEGFTGFEKGHGIAPGLVYAAEPGQKMLSKIIDAYCDKNFSLCETVCDIVTDIYISEGLKLNDSTQQVENMMVYSSEYFGCFDHETQHFCITENTISIHHYAGSWSSWQKKIHFKLIWLAATFLGPQRYKNIKHRMYKKKKEVS